MKSLIYVNEQGQPVIFFSLHPAQSPESARTTTHVSSRRVISRIMRAAVKLKTGVCVCALEDGHRKHACKCSFSLVERKLHTTHWFRPRQWRDGGRKWRVAPASEQQQRGQKEVAGRRPLQKICIPITMQRQWQRRRWRAVCMWPIWTRSQDRRDCSYWKRARTLGGRYREVFSWIIHDGGWQGVTRWLCRGTKGRMWRPQGCCCCCAPERDAGGGRHAAEGSSNQIRARIHNFRIARRNSLSLVVSTAI